MVRRGKVVSAMYTNEESPQNIFFTYHISGNEN